jgi:hypothetical protein
MNIPCTKDSRGAEEAGSKGNVSVALAKGEISKHEALVKPTAVSLTAKKPHSTMEKNITPRTDK